MADGYYDFSGAFANLNSAIDSVGKRWKEREQRQTLASLGADIEAGNYTGAARKAFAAGDADAGVKLATLGRTVQQENDWMKANGSLFGLGGQQSGTPAPSTPVAPLPSANAIENDFISGVRQAGLSNPIGLAAVAATGRAESSYSPQNANRTWNDPSQSGQAGTAGGIMSWRADRLRNLFSFAQSRGEQPGNISPQTQAMFFAQEDPTLIPRLQAARTPQEANDIMARAWRYAGYDKPGGETARRLALTQNYAARFGGQPGQPATAIPVQVAETEEDVRRLEAQQGAPDTSGGPVRMAQAPAATQADLPAEGAATAQGIVVPGASQVDASIANDPRVIRLQRALAGAPDRFKPSIQSRLNILVDELKSQRQQGGPLDQENKRLQNEKLRRDLQGDSKIRDEMAAREREADARGLQGPDRQAFIFNGKIPSQAEKAPTEGQANAALYAQRMKDAEAVLERPEIAAASASAQQRMFSNVPMAGNYIVSKEYQQAEQAQRNFINATLRRESGAVISPSEFENAEKQYFPRPGDSKEVLEQKRQNRLAAIRGIENAAGPQYAKRQQQGQQDQPSRADLEAEARRRGLIK